MKALKIFILSFLILLILGYLFTLKNDKAPKDLKDPENQIEFIPGEISINEVNGIEIIRKDLYVANPSTGSMWDISVFEPANSELDLPGVILVPGGTSDKSKFLTKASPEVDYSTAELFASEGFITLIFSAEGRGESEGEEDYNGHIDQDGLYELYKFLKNHKKIDENEIGIVSYSYGVAMASGMLGRYEAPLKYYIEFEGPVDKYYVTFDCLDRALDKEGEGAVKSGITCDDDDYWAEREALNFVPNFKVEHFIVVQKEKDHVQPTHNHSLDINNLAVEHLDWVRVNGSENEINQNYTYDQFPLIENKAEVNELIISYIKEL